jgi:hypothetical protein
MTGRPTGRRGAGTVWPRLREALRTTALVIYGVVASVGALFSPRTSLALGALFAVVAWALVMALSTCPGDDLPPLPHPLVAGAVTACLPAVVAGISALGAHAGLVVGVGLVLVTMLGGHWLDAPPARSASRPPAADPPGDEHSLRELLRKLPTDLLFDEWGRTQMHEVPAGGETSVDVRVRELLIDEMRQRDPAGTRRWLDEHPGDPPDRYVGRRSG